MANQQGTTSTTLQNSSTFSSVSSHITIPQDGIVRTTSGLRPSLTAIFQFSGKALAGVTKYEPFELRDDESNLLSDQADQVIVEFFPQASTKAGKLVAFIISLISIFGYKWFGYEKEQAKKIKKIKTDNDSNEKTQTGG